MHARAQALETAGFTIIELVVTITILGLLAAFAIPRLVSLDSTARIAAVNSLAGALQSAAELSYANCMTSAATTGCNTTVNAWQGTINGRPYWLNYGWPDAGDALNAGQIDSQVDYSGFSASLVSNAETLFYRADAPVPGNCSVAYYDGYYTPPKYHYVVTTSGC
jgi:MSHA pilin protein MshA